MPRRKQPLASTLDEVLQGELRLDVYDVEQGQELQVLDVQRGALESTLHKIEHTIGRMALEGREAFGNLIIEGHRIELFLEQNRLRAIAIQDQMRATMRDRLARVMKPGVLKSVSDDELDAFMVRLERSAKGAMVISRALADGYAKESE